MLRVDTICAAVKDMKDHGMLKMFGLAAIVTMLAAFSMWTFWPKSPRDLHITEIRIVRRIEVPRSDEPGKVSDPSQLLAIVRFQSSADLASLANNFVYQGLYAHYFLCRSRERISEGTNLIFDQFGRISFGESGAHGSTAPKYHVYLALWSSGIPGFGTYNLKKNPEDVCLVLVPESPEFGEGPKTNILRITQGNLMSALADPSH
jgi:hypothetical protein